MNCAGNFDRIKPNFELRSKIRLSDGTVAPIFTQNRRFASTANTSIMYNCHVCRVANIAGEQCLFEHQSSKRHIQSIESPIFDCDQYRMPMYSSTDFKPDDPTEGFLKTSAVPAMNMDDNKVRLADYIDDDGFSTVSDTSLSKMIEHSDVSSIEMVDKHRSKNRKSNT